MYDIIIIGAGVSGCACARELSRYDAKILVVEKEEDVCCGTSKANSAIVHAGYDAAHGSLMAKLNVEGSRRMPALAKELDFAYDRCGSLVVCLSDEDRPALQKLYENGIANGVEGLRIIERDELVGMEPNISDAAVAALWAPTGGIVCPFGLTFALAENAAKNGVQFRFDTKVTGLHPLDGGGTGWAVETDHGTLETRCIVNAAGVYADTLHNMADAAHPMTITARRGDYFLLDHTAGQHVRHTVFQLPGKYGKGVLVTPTVHGNLLVGPTAIDVDDKEATATTAAGLDEVREKSGLAVKDIPLRQTITSFAGLRAHEARHDFFIGEIAPGFVDCAAIESPGLSSAPAIGAMVADIVRGSLHLHNKPDLPDAQGHSGPQSTGSCSAGGAYPTKPGLRADYMPVRERDRGRDHRRHPPHARRTQFGRRQAAHPRGHGPLPGGLLQSARHGDSGAGAGRAAERDHQVRRCVQNHRRHEQG